jgi:glycerate kinase
MKIVVASDKYKGSLSALEVCTTIANTIRKLDPSVEVITSPMADGGEGTVKTLVESLEGKIVELEVTGPLGDKVIAGLGLLDNGTAVIEMASASGYVLVPADKRNPMLATTYGTGELIKKALELGSRKVIVGIGGSATNDGGMGMAQALGYEFLGKDDGVLGFGGKQLGMLARIKKEAVIPLLQEAVIEVASDVDNPLYGKRGAAHVYGPQKGASPEMVEELDRGLKNFAEVVLKDLGKDVARIPGAGAAGGLGAGLVAFTDAVLRPGTEIVTEVTGLEEKIKGADLVITGEGAMDEQTYYGKSPMGVARLASKYDIPAITINGSVLVGRNSIDEKNSCLFDGNFSIINRPMTLEQALEGARSLLEGITEEIIGFYLKINKK